MSTIALWWLIRAILCLIFGRKDDKTIISDVLPRNNEMTKGTQNQKPKDDKIQAKRRQIQLAN